MKHIIPILIGGFLVARSLIADGTLPFLLPFGDGTLPFDMYGELNVDEQPTPSTGTVVMSFRARSANPPGGIGAESIPSCPRPLNWYAIPGKVVVQYGAIPTQNEYDILGVCSLGTDPGQRVVIARNGAETLHMEGSLKAQGPLQVFTGTASVRDANNRVVRRFAFVLD